MTVLYLNLAVVFIFSFFARYFAASAAAKSAAAALHVKPNLLMAFVAACSLVLVSGLRKNMADTYFYMFSYARTTYTWDTIKGQKDIGFNIFQMILQQFSHNPQIMIFVTAMITNVLIVLVLYKYTRLFELSLYVYITSGMFLVSMNGLRQFLAAAIAFAATKYIMDGNWKKYILVIIVAAQIHLSALLLIPVYFIVRRKAWSGTIFLILAITVVIVVGFKQFTTILFAAIESTQYNDYRNIGDFQGANVLRVAVEAVPVLLAYLGRHKLREIFPNSDFVVNMSLMSLVFMIVATQSWIFARFCIYFGLYQLILISWVVKLFTKKDQKLVYYGILLCYFIFFYYEEVVSYGGHIYQSDFLG